MLVTREHIRSDPPKRAGATRILIVDDHPLMREALQRSLHHSFKEVCLGEAQSAQEALKLIRKERWDLVVLDVALPGRSGLDILLDIKAARSRLPVLIVSGSCDRELGLRALRSGASGFLSKTSAAQELIQAVKTILGGGRYVSQELAGQIALEAGTKAGYLTHESLSNREREVLCLIANAKMPPEIAQNLGISVKTVSTYRSRILLKMNMQTTAELMRYAIKHGLVD